MCGSSHVSEVRPAEVLMKKELKPHAHLESDDRRSPAEVLMKKELKLCPVSLGSSPGSGRSPDEEGTETQTGQLFDTSKRPAEVLMKKELKRGNISASGSVLVRPKS